MASNCTEPAATLVDHVQRHASERANEVALEWLSGDNPVPVARLTFSELNQRAHALASSLEAAGLRNERVLLPFPPGLDFIVSFLGCLQSGAVPVPAAFPRNPRTIARTIAILRDCTPALCLSSAAELAPLQNKLEPFSSTAFASLEDHLTKPAALPAQPLSSPERSSVAYLQYTSGTGGTAKGVMVTHANLLHNIRALQQGCDHPVSAPFVSWLPQHHDMQLVTVIAQSLMLGTRCVLMSPVDFIQKPQRWLRAISREGACFSGGPNFAFDHCVRQIPERERTGLDLSQWQVAFNSSEKIRPATMQAFATAFSRHGFTPTAWCPAYGLAESTAVVTGVHAREEPVISSNPESGHDIVACGYPVPECEIRIVHPERLTPLDSGEIGEVWIHGTSVARGYWNRPVESAATFAVRLADDSASGPFLRSGDLGFVDESGRLFLTGRLKNLIVIRGIKHQAEDLESGLEEFHPAIRPAGIAAFSVDRDGDREELVICAEMEREHRHAPDIDAIVEACQIAVNRDHDLVLDHLVLLKPGGLPRTTSGKLQRQTCRHQFSQSSFDSIAQWHRIARLPRPDITSTV